MSFPSAKTLKSEEGTKHALEAGARFCDCVNPEAFPMIINAAADNEYLTKFKEKKRIFIFDDKLLKAILMTQS